ncbi:hypothetical protein [Gordonia terrae]|uniref:hypothetical protein n=1 Tax=Gordonia terrae TaxID=2055 RepID=UPI003F6B54EA
MLTRVDRLPGGVARLVDAVPDEDITRCLHQLVATALDVTAASTPEIRDVTRHWRQHGSAAPEDASRLRLLAAQHDFDAFAYHRRGDIDAQRDSFRRARALDCALAAMSTSLAGQSLRAALGETAYEAAAALGAGAGVVAILADHVM